eukprot:TRINITY_DN4255_c0_g1_i1.p1 TRINITY_DN4255_c0_g1~~TRINITY_DN4255_c0_g1_i1.p1  ORF type:complete len:483 (+),score=108.34 TRINITY_DN4255_c0_g1_i1:151-1599(+)
MENEEQLTPRRAALVGTPFAELLKKTPSMSLLNLTPGSNFELGFTAEKASLVIDIGNQYSRLGFAGESCPRIIIPSQFSLSNGKKLTMNNSLGSKSYSKEEWKEAFESFFNSVYFSHLQANTKDERKVVIVENYLSLNVVKDAISEVLYHKFKVPSLMFVQSQSISLIPMSLNHKHALIVDCGATETRVLPIYDGTPLSYAFLSAPFGFYSVRKRLAQLLKDESVLVNHSKSMRSPLQFHPAKNDCNELELFPIGEEKKTISLLDMEDIIAKLVYIEPGRAEENTSQLIKKMRSQSQLEPSPWPHNHNVTLKSVDTSRIEKDIQIPAESQSSKLKERTKAEGVTKYPLDQSNFLELNNDVRSKPVEVLFEGDEETESVSTLVLKSLKQVPSDVRMEISQNILIIGGTSMIPGFKSRLMREIRLLTQHPSFSELSGLKDQFCLLKCPHQSNCVGWIAGSVIGSLDLWSTFGTTKETYLMNQKQ